MQRNKKSPVVPAEATNKPPSALCNNSTAVALTVLCRTPIPRRAAPTPIADNNENLLEQVITQAQKTFVCGYKNNTTFRRKINNDPSLKEKIRPDAAKQKFPQYKDDVFPAYDANRISGTHFIAAAGPTFLNVANFLESTVLNPQLPIQEIVALGDVLGIKTNTDNKYDFYDYCSRKNKETKFYHIGEDDESYEMKVKIKRLSGEVKHDSTGCRYPAGIIQSRVKVSRSGSKLNKTEQTPAEVNITIWKLRDNLSINLTEGASCNGFSQSPEECKEILWQIFKKSLSNPVLIHCHSGVGRTGHLILILELLKYHVEIFSSQDPEIIAAETHKIVDRIREKRPALIATKDQFAAAIRNAEILYRYALEHKYIETGQPVWESAANNIFSAADRQNINAVDITAAPIQIGPAATPRLA